MSTPITFPPSAHTPSRKSSGADSDDSNWVDCERASIASTQVSTSPTVRAPSNTPVAPPILPTSTIVQTQSPLPRIPTTSKPRRDFGGWICAFFTLAALGGIIYGIYYKVHQDKTHEAEAYAQKVAQAEAVQAARNAADRAVFNATIRGPEVFWQMLQEMKDFKVALASDMKELKDAMLAVSGRAA